MEHVPQGAGTLSWHVPHGYTGNRNPQQWTSFLLGDSRVTLGEELRIIVDILGLQTSGGALVAEGIRESELHSMIVHGDSNAQIPLPLQ